MYSNCKTKNILPVSEPLVFFIDWATCRYDPPYISQTTLRTRVRCTCYATLSPANTCVIRENRERMVQSVVHYTSRPTHQSCALSVHPSPCVLCVKSLFLTRWGKNVSKYWENYCTPHASPARHTVHRPQDLVTPDRERSRFRRGPTTVEGISVAASKVVWCSHYSTLRDVCVCVILRSSK